VLDVSAAAIKEKGTSVSESLERLARNETLFREVNERIEYLADVNERIGYHAEGATSEFVCECSNPECIETIELNLKAYERIRSNPTWFLLKSDHDISQIERVVSRDDGYAVVEKLILEEYMQETDPRSDGAEGSGSSAT
jgi:hypothetical protein